MMRPRLEAVRAVLSAARRGLRQHRRQRGGPPAAADGRASSARTTSSPRSWSTSTPRAASSAAASRPRTSTSSSTRARCRTARSTPSSPSQRRPARLPADRRTTGGATGDCRCATPTRSSTRSPRRPCTSRSTATPRPAGSRPRRSTASLEIKPVFGDGAPGGVAVVGGPDRRAARRPGLPLGRRGERAGAPTCSRSDWLHEGPPQEAPHHLAGRGDRLDRHRGRRAQGAGRPPLRVAQADRAAAAGSSRRCRTTRACSTPSPAAVRRATRSRSRTRPTVDGVPVSRSTPPEPVRPGSNADLAGYARVSDVTRARLRAVARRGRRRLRRGVSADQIS